MDQESSMHGGPSAHGQLTRRTVLLACIGSTAAMLLCAWWFGLREPQLRILPPTPEAMRKARGGGNMAPMAQMSGRPVAEGTPTKPLEAGAELPSLVAQGWINGPPPAADELAGHPAVLDVWDEL